MIPLRSTRDDDDDDDDDDRSHRNKERFQEGDKVEANFKGKGKWFKGRISRDRRDGTYDISFDDGDSEKAVDAVNIRFSDSKKRSRSHDDDDDDNRRRGGSASAKRPFRIFEKVMAKSSRGRWLEAEIDAVNRDGSYNVRYIESQDLERDVPEEDVKPLKDDKSSRSGRKFYKGDEVQVEQRNGDYRKGKIILVNSDDTVHTLPLPPISPTQLTLPIHPPTQPANLIARFILIK